jgi:hypothetical protein
LTEKGISFWVQEGKSRDNAKWMPRIGPGQRIEGKMKTLLVSTGKSENLE